MPNQTEFPFANARRISESEVIAAEQAITQQFGINGHWFREMGGQKHYYVYARVIIECRKATERELQYGLILSSLSLLHKHRNLCSYSLSNEGKWRAKHLPLPQVRHIFQ